MESLADLNKQLHDSYRSAVQTNGLVIFSVDEYLKMLEQTDDLAKRQLAMLDDGYLRARTVFALKFLRDALSDGHDLIPIMTDKLMPVLDVFQNNYDEIVRRAGEDHDLIAAVNDIREYWLINQPDELSADQQLEQDLRKSAEPNPDMTDDYFDDDIPAVPVDGATDENPDTGSDDEDLPGDDLPDDSSEDSSSDDATGEFESGDDDNDDDIMPSTSSYNAGKSFSDMHHTLVSSFADSSANPDSSQPSDGDSDDGSDQENDDDIIPSSQTSDDDGVSDDEDDDDTPLPGDDLPDDDAEDGESHKPRFSSND